MAEQTSDAPRRVCADCNVEKDLFTEFGKDAKGKDGYRPICKACRNARDHARPKKPGTVTSIRSRRPKKKELSPDEKYTARVNLMALRRLAEMYPRDFARLVSQEKEKAGFEKKWVSIK